MMLKWLDNFVFERGRWYVVPAKPGDFGHNFYRRPRWYARTTLRLRK